MDGDIGAGEDNSQTAPNDIEHRALVFGTCTPARRHSIPGAGGIEALCIPGHKDCDIFDFGAELDGSRCSKGIVEKRDHQEHLVQAVLACSLMRAFVDGRFMGIKNCREPPYFAWRR